MSRYLALSGRTIGTSIQTKSSLTWRNKIILVNLEVTFDSVNRYCVLTGKDTFGTIMQRAYSGTCITGPYYFMSLSLDTFMIVLLGIALFFQSASFLLNSFFYKGLFYLRNTFSIYLIERTCVIQFSPSKVVDVMKVNVGRIFIWFISMKVRRIVLAFTGLTFVKHSDFRVNYRVSGSKNNSWRKSSVFLKLHHQSQCFRVSVGRLLIVQS